MQISNIHFTSVSRIMQTGRYQNVRPFWIVMIEVVAVTTENAPRFNTLSLWRGSDLSTPKYSNTGTVYRCSTAAEKVGVSSSIRLLRDMSGLNDGRPHDAVD